MAEFGSGNLKYIERSSLDSFSEALRFLHFDKAKEIIDKELDQNKSVLSSNWRAFLNACSELCSHEKSYYSLAYLLPRAPIFARKENLRDAYRTLSAELQRVSRASSAKLVSHVSDQLVEFVQARLDLMDVYAALATQTSTQQQQQQLQQQQQQQLTPQQPNPLQCRSRESVIADVESLMQRYRGKFHHPKLAGISNCFEDETEILFHLLNASGRINNLYFLESMLSLHEVNNRLVVWQDQATKYHLDMMQKPKKLHKTAQPNLLHWFHRFYAHLLSKYTLCFCSVLAQQSPSGQQLEIVRMAQQRQGQQDSEDLLSRLVQLHKRSDCLAALLIFNATAQVEPYLGHGYYLPGLVGDRPVGKDGFPVIFVYPTAPPESAAGGSSGPSAAAASASAATGLLTSAAASASAGAAAGVAGSAASSASALATGGAVSAAAAAPAAVVGQGDMTNILMTVASESWGSGAGGSGSGECRVRFFSDDKLRRSYCIGFAEPRLHLALVLEHKAAQRSGAQMKERKAVEQQVVEFCYQLAGCGLYGMLRSGGR